MILEPPMIAAQALLNPMHRLIGTRIGVVGTAFSMQRNFRVEMHVAFGAKPRALALHRDMPGISAVEIFAHDFAYSRDDALAQCFANIQIFA